MANWRNSKSRLGRDWEQQMSSRNQGTFKICQKRALFWDLESFTKKQWHNVTKQCPYISGMLRNYLKSTIQSDFVETAPVDELLDAKLYHVWLLNRKTWLFGWIDRNSLSDMKKWCMKSIWIRSSIYQLQLFLKTKILNNWVCDFKQKFFELCISNFNCRKRNSQSVGKWGRFSCGNLHLLKRKRSKWSRTSCFWKILLSRICVLAWRSSEFGRYSVHWPVSSLRD